MCMCFSSCNFPMVLLISYHKLFNITVKIPLCLSFIVAWHVIQLIGHNYKDIMAFKQIGVIENLFKSSSGETVH